MNGPSAFPCPPTHAGGEYHSGWDGMTLRDYFAIRAMQVLLQASIVRTKGPEPAQVASDSYAMADRMLEARNQ